MVSRRTRVVSWIFRRDHPNRPKAMSCCFFSSFKTFAILREATYPVAAVSVLKHQTRNPVFRLSSTKCEHLLGNGIHASRGLTASHRAEDGDPGKKAMLGHNEPPGSRRGCGRLG